MTCVYKITNPIGQIYIGSTSNFKKREYYYRSVSSRKQIKIYNYIQAYGWHNHTLEILEECSKENMWERERYFGLLYSVLEENGLNSTLPKADGQKGIFSKEMKHNMRNRKGGYKGTPHTEASKEKIRQVQLGRKHTAEHRLKVSLNSARINSKLVLNTETGIFYDSIKQAAETYNYIHSTLKQRLGGHLENNTSFIKA